MTYEDGLCMSQAKHGFKDMLLDFPLLPQRDVAGHHGLMLVPRPAQKKPTKSTEGRLGDATPLPVPQTNQYSPTTLIEATSRRDLLSLLSSNDLVLVAGSTSSSTYPAAQLERR